MADNSADKEKIKLLEEQNKILQKQLELQAEGYSLSTSYIESLKEVLGVRSRQTTEESNLLNVNKQINKSILDQKVGSSDINELQKQISKNQDLLNKAKLQEKSLSNSLSELDKNRVNQASIRLKALSNIQKELDAELSKSKEEQDLNRDHILNLQKRLSLNEKYLETATENMSQSARALLYTQEQRKELEKQNIEREKEKKHLEDIEKKLGVYSGILKGLGKIPIIGDLVDTNAALEAAKKTTEATGSGLKGLGAGLKNLGSQITTSLTNPANAALFILTQIGKTFLSLDKAIGDFAKGMNLTYTEAAKLDNTFNSIANSSGDTAVTTRGIRESVLAIGQALGSNAILNAKDAVSMTQFREQAGLAQDELNEMQKISLATNKTLEDNVASTLYAAKVTGLKNGVLLNEKQIMSEVAKASAATKLSLSNTPELVARAAAQAKALGMNLEQVSNIADKLLSIESSISDELEAELLTGKNLNLEQARLYALNNDMEGLSREIAKNFGSAAEFSKMNRLQQEAAAKAVGMSREELAKTLTDQEALKGLSGAQAKDAQAALDAARARGMSEEDIKKKGVEGLKQQQSMQDRFNKSIEKLQELFVGLLEPLMPVLDVFTSILKVVGLIFKPLEAISSWAKSISGPLGSVMKVLIGIGAAALLLNGSLTFGLGVAAVLAAVGGGMALFEGIKSKASTADDMVSPGYGKRTLMGPEGAIALNDKDTVIAGTNLFDKKGNDIVSEPGKNTTFKAENEIKTSSGVDMSAVIEELRSLKAALQTFNQKPVQVSVTMDGRKVAEGLGNHATQLGTSANVGTSKIQ